ncbi:MAG TPA: hypothetical protein VFP20_10815 [Bacteroidales bacterium]|nr:hypothetical protein [Bacteroidales bacterium]
MKKILSALLLLSLISCTTSRYEVPGKPELNITIQRFDKAFYETGLWPDSTFLNLYANEIMEVGEPGSKMFKQFETIFRNDADIKKLYTDCQKTFSDVSDIEEELTWGFHRMQYFFPNIPIPKVYMHIAGYGESIVSAPGILSADIDKYLGKDYDVYKNLFSPYQAARMYPEKLVSDYMTGWVRSELTEYKLMDNQRLLDYMLYEGKILFLIQVLLPDESLENLSGFNTSQLDWCANNEKKMWTTLLQHQQLYSSDASIINKYLREAPNTVFFGQDSPGRAVIWVGYRIVSSYMEKNPKVTVQDLMLRTKAQDLLKGATYRP